jgi:hypothetical protein
VEAACAAVTSLSAAAGSENASSRSSLAQFLSAERQGIYWVAAVALVGFLIGFVIGTGHLTMSESEPALAWRKSLGIKIRSSLTYRLLTLRTKPWSPLLNMWESSVSLATISRKNLMEDPANPRTFDVLVEAIMREKGGWVHPDLGMLIPAPSGAARGIGMVRDGYTTCQRGCIPGIASEKQQPTVNKTKFMPEEVLIRIPLSYQMTREVALNTLLPMIPSDPQRKDPLQELDDAALLVLLLAHERAVSRASKWMPYIASLPTEPQCGYSTHLRPYFLDAVKAYRTELGVDTHGWPRELSKASKYAEKIASGLTRDYGSFIKAMDGVSVFENLQWALCQVASRATAGSDKHGALRLIPLMDMINHDANAGGFVELRGDERFENGDFVNATEEDAGTFVVRSLRHGRRKPLKKGQELMVNYNVPQYSPLDWFISLGFVPPERWRQWQKVDSALPKVRKDGPYSSMRSSSTRFTGRAGSDL